MNANRKIIADDIRYALSEKQAKYGNSNHLEGY